MSAEEIKKDLEESGFFENKYCFNIHAEKMRKWKKLTRDQENAVAQFVTTNRLTTRDALYIGQGVSLGLTVAEGYEYCLDYDKPPHPLFIEKKFGIKVKK